MATGTQYRAWVGFLMHSQPLFRSEKAREPGYATGWGGRDRTGSDPVRNAMPRSIYAGYEAIWNSIHFDPAAAGGVLNFQAATFTATGSLATTELLIKGIVANFTATGTLTRQRLISKGTSFAATGTLTRQRLISVFKGFTATGTLTKTAGRLLNVAANMAATGTLAVSRQLSMGVSRTFSAIGTLVTGETFIPGAVGPVILAEYVRRFMTYLGRRW